MTKTFRSILSLFLAVFMVVSLAAVPSSAISISKSSVTLTKGYQTQLSVSGTSKTVTWSTGDKSIATVSSKGKVVGKNPGTTYVYAKVSGNTLKCKVTVVAAKITASSSNVTFSKKGETKTITMTVKGSHSGLTVGTTNKNVVSASWVKPVSWNGDKIKINLTAKGTGTAKVKVYLKSYSSTCYKNIDVKVGNTNDEIFGDGGSTSNNNTSSGNISILPYTKNVEVTPGGTYTLQVYSTNQTNTSFSVADTSIASVTAGKASDRYRNYTIKGLKQGTTTLRLYNKNNTSNYYDVKITVNGNQYYEFYTVRPTVQSPDKVMEIRVDSRTTYYMIVPENYDPAYTNGLIAQKFRMYSYYEVYNTVPTTKIAATDTYYEFSHTNSKYTYGMRYVLVPDKYDKAKLNTAVAKYNGRYEFWTVYTEYPSNAGSWDGYVEKWQILDPTTGKMIDRYLLVPIYAYDEARIQQIKDSDVASNSAYSQYIGYDQYPSAIGTNDQCIMYVKNGKNKYMIVPKDGSGRAKANDAIAKDTGIYEYNVIYSTAPTAGANEKVSTIYWNTGYYYVLLKDKDQVPDQNLAIRYANGVKDD